MRYLLAGFLLAASITAAHAQKTIKKFSLPERATINDYQAGKVLVKIKSEYKSLFDGSVTSGRMPNLGGTIRALAPKTIGSRNSAGRVKAFKPVVDISQYVEISFDASRAVEDFINELYASGYVELAEPAYTHRMLFTPNDPSLASQYYLSKIKALEAWDVTFGSEDVLIGIVDSGVDIDHPDLVNKLRINDADPVNGIDDDNNGFIDDWRGWDFSGADTATVNNPDFVGDNDPGITKSGPGFNHGTQVGACAGASVNNGIGMAGVGYRSKLMFTKHFSDNQKSTSRSYNSDLYKGVLYLVDQGARVINCSWGGEFKSQIYQDIMTFVTVDMGCVVVAAAGNDGDDGVLYPAAYDNVISVAATDSDDKRAGFSNYGPTIDISAPGVGIFTAEFDNNYGFSQGTSFSSPIVAGAAALVIATHPDFTPLQVAEQLRVTADESMYQQNGAFLYKLGKGRLDVHKAVTAVTPSVRASNLKLNAVDGTNKMKMVLDFKNYLTATSGALQISISTTSPLITITKDKITPGAIGKGVTITNTTTPFEFTTGTVPEGTEVNILITYTDGTYNDTQMISISTNPPYRNIDDNLIKTSISSAGRVGFQNTENSSNGVGFVFNEASMLYEMGVMMGSSSASILNTVRNASQGYDQDFVSLAPIQEIIPGERANAEVFGAFSNSSVAENQTVNISYRTLVWQEEPYDQFVIVEYKIKNPKATALTNFYFGLFADWDINLGGQGDAAAWHAQTQMGYVYPKQSTLPLAGVQLLTENPLYYAIDNDHTIVGNPLGIYDGYTDLEKFTSLSSGAKAEAGTSTAQGNDVSHVVSSGPFTINANEEITVTFALHAANNLTDLVTSAKFADSLYNFAFNIEAPIVEELTVCYGEGDTLKATGAENYKWYVDQFGGDPLSIDSQLVVTDLTSDTIFYVSNASYSIEGLRIPAYVKVKGKPSIQASGSTAICEGTHVTLSSGDATEYLWSNGATTQSIEVSDPGDYSVTIKFIEGDLNCEAVSAVVPVTTLSNPEAAFEFETGELNTHNPIQFTDTSVDAVTWAWDFGDGETSDEQNPEHTFTDHGNVEVQLTVTASNGCSDTIREPLFLITTAEADLRKHINVFPVPTGHEKITVDVNGLNAQYLTIRLLNAQGGQITNTSFSNIPPSFRHTIETTHYPSGVYFLRVQVDNTMIVKKVIIQK